MRVSRSAAARGGELTVGPVALVRTAAYASLRRGARRLSRSGGAALAAAICAAGPVEGEDASAVIHLTNCPWEVGVAALARATGVARPRVMNDFAALALGGPAPCGRAMSRPSAGRVFRVAAAPVVVIGAADRPRRFGAGLRRCAGACRGGRGRPCRPGAEGPARNGGPVASAGAVRPCLGRARLVRPRSCDASWRRLSRSTAPRRMLPLTPEEIAIRAHGSECPLSREAVALFCGWLGAVAYDVAPTLGARRRLHRGRHRAGLGRGHARSFSMKSCSAPASRPRAASNPG